MSVRGAKFRRVGFGKREGGVVDVSDQVTRAQPRSLTEHRVPPSLSHTRRAKGRGHGKHEIVPTNDNTLTHISLTYTHSLLFNRCFPFSEDAVERGCVKICWALPGRRRKAFGFRLFPKMCVRAGGGVTGCGLEFSFCCFVEQI